MDIRLFLRYSWIYYNIINILIYVYNVKLTVIIKICSFINISIYVSRQEKKFQPLL